MKELIKITEQNGKQAVSARELHTFLESKYQFTDWVKERINRYELIENQDYIIFSEKTEKGRPRIEYALSIDCAKELSMVENNAKGKQARKYFIACENKLKEGFTPLSLTEILVKSTQILDEHDKELKEQKTLIVDLYQKIEDLEKRDTLNLTAQNCAEPKRTRRKKFVVENPDAKGSTRDPLNKNMSILKLIRLI